VTPHFAVPQPSDAGCQAFLPGAGLTTRTPAVKPFRQSFTLRSVDHVQVVDITKQVRDIVAVSEIQGGLVLVNALHTTCALFVNEFQGALVEDFKTILRQLVADHGGYKHDDSRYSDCERGNGSAHLRAALLARSVLVGISGGDLSLGRFQSILFAEFDGPRSRVVDVQLLGV